jgi:hypothetical protein
MTELGDHTNNALWEGSYLSLSKNDFQNIKLHWESDNKHWFVTRQVP